MEKSEAPTTIKEVGIHISYLREDMHALTNEIKDLKSGFATKEEISNLKESADQEHKAIWEEIKNIKSSARWWVGTILVGFSIAIAALGLWK